MDFPFNMGLGGLAHDSIVSRLFGRNQYTPQSDALLAAPDTNSMPAGSPPPAPQVTTPNLPMGGGLAGLFGGGVGPSLLGPGGGGDDKMKQFMSMMDLMKAKQGPQPMPQPMQPQMATPFGGFGGGGGMPGGGGSQPNQLMELLRLAGQRRV